MEPDQTIDGRRSIDSDLRLSFDGQGHLLLTWLSNADGEFLSTSVSPSTLKHSFWNGVAWATPAAIANNLVGVSSHAAAQLGTRLSLYFHVILTLPATGDSVLDVYKWDGATWSAIISLRRVV